MVHPMETFQTTFTPLRSVVRSIAVILIMSFLAMACAHVEPQPIVPTPQVLPPPTPPPRPAKIAVALGAGAAKGFAHVGVLKILESQGVPIHMVVGTSAGSFVGALYASGMDGFAIQKVALAMDKDDVADLTIPDNGFLKGERLEEFVNRAVKGVPIDRMKIPFHAVATDVRKGEAVVFSRGNTGQAVRASCAVPGVFRPVKIGDAVYIDGGLVESVPVESARKMGADVVIAVDITAQGENPVPQSTLDTLLTSIGIMYARLAQRQVEGADVVIRPAVGGFPSGDFERRNEAIMEGEKAALAAMPKIREIVERLRAEGRVR